MKKQSFKRDLDLFLSLYGDENLQDYEDFLRQVQRQAWLFSSLPFVKEIAICNSVAFKRADKDSDIDLLLIFDARRFFMARFILSMALHILAWRRYDDKIKRRYCLSFIIDDKQLAFEDILIENDVYFYYWFRHLIFLKGNKNLQVNLLKTNATWFKEEDFAFKNLLFVRGNFFAKILEKILGCFCFDLLESWLKKYQLKRAWRKNREINNPFGVVIKSGFLKFHVKDTRKHIRDRYLLLLR